MFFACCLGDRGQPFGGRLRPVAPIPASSAERTSRCRRRPARRCGRCCRPPAARCRPGRTSGRPSPWSSRRPRSCPCRARAASSGARRSASPRRRRAGRRSAPRTRTARACRAAGPSPSTSAVRDPGLLDERPDVGVGLRVGRALAEDDQRLLCALQKIERALHRFGGGDLLRRRIDDLDQRLPPGLGVDRSARTAWRAGRGRRRPGGRTPRRGWRARCRRRCRRHAARGRPPWRPASRWQAGPSLRSRPAAGRRSRARSSR